jgi:hypothetical protein
MIKDDMCLIEKKKAKSFLNCKCTSNKCKNFILANHDAHDQFLTRLLDFGMLHQVFN